MEEKGASEKTHIEVEDRLQRSPTQAQSPLLHDVETSELGRNGSGP